MSGMLLKILLSAILSVGTAILVAKGRRGKGDVFYVSNTFVYFWASFVFTIGVWFFGGWVDLYNDPELPGQGVIGIIVILLIVWLVLFLALIDILCKRYQVKNNFLIKRGSFFKIEYSIDIRKIKSIETVYSYESQHYDANMSDGGSYHIDDSIGDMDRFFYRLAKINDQIHFNFPIHHAAEGSFFDRFVNLGMFVAVLVFAVGFYMLLGRLL